MRNLSWIWVGLCLYVTAGPVAAHTGEVAGSGFVVGFLHPVMGVDHVLAMVAVGLWGAFLRAPAMIVLPIAFPLVMAIGGVIGAVGIHLPAVETGIALSAMVIGGAVAFMVRPPLWIAAIIVAIFAIFHGHAHGTEMPSVANPAAYSIGFVMATGLLHLAGITIGLLARSATGTIVVRTLGAAIAMGGAGFLAGVL